MYETFKGTQMAGLRSLERAYLKHSNVREGLVDAVEARSHMMHIDPLSLYKVGIRSEGGATICKLPESAQAFCSMQERCDRVEQATSRG
jgi:hypothetical protein